MPEHFTGPLHETTKVHGHSTGSNNEGQLDQHWPKSLEQIHKFQLRRKKTDLFRELQALEAQNCPNSCKDWEANAALKVFQGL